MEQNLSSLWNSNFTLSQKLVRAPLRLIPSKTRVSVLSGVNKGMTWIVGSSIHACWIGSYEADKQELLARTIKPGNVIWDIGANVGFYTLAFSRAVGELGKVLAFEPNAQEVAYLLRHITLNALKNVVVVQVAVGEREGLVSFSVEATSSMGKIEATATAYNVPSISVDEYLLSNPGMTPDIIKMDVEGAEAFVLAGAKKLLVARKPELWIALHGNQARMDCLQALRKLNYRIYDLNENELKDADVNDEIIAR